LGQPLTTKTKDWQRDKRQTPDGVIVSTNTVQEVCKIR